MSQPTPPTPPAPPTPPSPSVEEAFRTLEGLTAGPAVVAPPRTARELEGLRVRREMLRNQLEGAEDRRQELAQQLNHTEFTDGDARVGLGLRVKDADARALQLERDIAATDRALTLAPPEVLAQTEQREPRVVHTGASEDEVLGIGATGFGLGLLTMLVAARIRRWRRRGERPAARDAAGADPRIDRLAHAVDAIAVEVERIGEGQRFVTQLLAESRAGEPQLREPRYAEAGVTAEALPAPGRPR